MCTVCGCQNAAVSVDFVTGPQSPGHNHNHTHEQPHFGGSGDGEHNHGEHGHLAHGNAGHLHVERAVGLINFGGGLAGLEVAGLSQERTIRIERDILSKNNSYADINRARFNETETFAVNFVSSPGSGKTSLLVRTITDLQTRWPINVIEGDQQTSRDAERILATGVAVVQINTGKGCHLDAHMVGHALDRLPQSKGGLLFIENVGNLVCPAAFDLGEANRVVLLSVTEGEDKPLKYPDMFAASDLMLLNKCDLLRHLDFDVDACIAAALQVNPRIQILSVSARTGEGLAAIYAWIEGRATALARSAEPSQ